MRRMFAYLKNRIVMIGLLTGSVLIGGVIVGVAKASIPDSNGTIHACRLNATGTIRIIDSSSQSCTGLETGINWSQNGNGAQVLYDANNQVLGNLLTSTYIGGSNPIQVYNVTVGRTIDLTYNSDSGNYDVGDDVTAQFESSGCTGQPYYDASPVAVVKLSLFRWAASSGPSYGIIANDATASDITTNSYLGDDGSCIQETDELPDAAPLTSVSLPFTTPVATPFIL